MTTREIPYSATAVEDGDQIVEVAADLDGKVWIHAEDRDQAIDLELTAEQATVLMIRLGAAISHARQEH